MAEYCTEERSCIHEPRQQELCVLPKAVYPNVKRYSAIPKSAFAASGFDRATAALKMCSKTVESFPPLKLNATPSLLRQASNIWYKCRSFPALFDSDKA